MSAAIWNIPEHLARKEPDAQNAIRLARYRRKAAIRNLNPEAKFQLDIEGVANVR